MSIMTNNAPSAPAPPPAQEHEEPGQDRRRVIMLAVGGLAVLLVAVLAYFFLIRSGSSDVANAPLPTPHPNASASASAAPPATPLRSFAGQTAKDPFKPLYEDNGTTSGTSTTNSDGTTSSSTSGTSTAGSASGSSTGAGTTGSTLPSSSVPLTVKLKSADATAKDATLTVQPQGKKVATYHPNLGQPFATYFKLTGFYTDTTDNTTQCVLLQYGDASTTLCKGATLKIQ